MEGFSAMSNLNSRTIGVIGWACLIAANVAWAQKAEHPLDPLSFQEYWTVLQVLRDGGHLSQETRFSLANLHDPLKDLVWNWSPGKDFRARHLS